MEPDDQIFLQLDSEQGLVEFLLLPQPMRMIRAKHVTKSEIETVVATGYSLDGELYSKAFLNEDEGTVAIIRVYLDHILKVVEQVEKIIS